MFSEAIRCLLATAKTIFPQRKIGVLSEGYESGFLALEDNPLEDLQNVRKIKLRFKQGVLYGTVKIIRSVSQVVL